MGTTGTSKQKQTVVEDGTELRGKLKSACSVVVNGTFDGEIEAPELSVTGTGAVEGTIRVEMLVSEGTLAGNIDADQVQLSGTVRNRTTIRASDLDVRLVQESGKLEVEFGECVPGATRNSAASRKPGKDGAEASKKQEASGRGG